MDILVLIWVAVSHIIDFIKEAVSALAQPFVLGIIYLTLALNTLKNHLDHRMDRLQRHLDEIEDKISRNF